MSAGAEPGSFDHALLTSRWLRMTEGERALRFFCHPEQHSEAVRSRGTPDFFSFVILARVCRAKNPGSFRVLYRFARGDSRRIDTALAGSLDCASLTRCCSG